MHPYRASRSELYLPLKFARDNLLLADETRLTGAASNDRAKTGQWEEPRRKSLPNRSAEPYS